MILFRQLQIVCFETMLKSVAVALLSFGFGQSAEHPSVSISFPGLATTLLVIDGKVRPTPIDNNTLKVDFPHDQDPLTVVRRVCSAGVLDVNTDDVGYACHGTVMKAYCDAFSCTPEQKTWECCTPAAGISTNTPNCSKCSIPAATLQLHDVLTKRICSVPNVQRACNGKCPACFEGNTGSIPSSLHALTTAAAHPEVGKGTICEIGFNAGHSAIAYLAVNPTAHIVAFDLGHWEYTSHAFTEIQNMFPHATIELVLGDSKRSVRDFAALHPNFRCNLLFIDGDHTVNGAIADMKYMAALADPAYHLLIVDDASDARVASAWDTAIVGGWITLAKPEDLPGTPPTPPSGSEMYRANVDHGPSGGISALSFHFNDYNMYVGRFTDAAIQMAVSERNTYRDRARDSMRKEEL